MDRIDLLQVCLRVLSATKDHRVPDPADVAALQRAHPELTRFEDVGELTARSTEMEIKKRKWRWGAAAR